MFLIILLIILLFLFIIFFCTFIWNYLSFNYHKDKIEIKNIANNSLHETNLR